MSKQLVFDFGLEPAGVCAKKASSPKGYTGLYGFHKYWGKKPWEPLAFVIEQLTSSGDTVLDPFVGSGTAARESRLRGRRFIGFDINPVASELTKLLVSPPAHDRIANAFRCIEAAARDGIEESYRVSDGRIASHYLWEGGSLSQIWLKGKPGVAREEFPPTSHDLGLVAKHSRYKTKLIRAPRFFSNGRINARADLAISDILTGRAQRNLDLLIKSIDELPHDVRMPMKLCLTAASGQMTKMVFAVTGRGKTKGKESAKIEVGSWVIGYWRPEQHFEVNVWNCFERRVTKLLKSIKDGDSLQGNSVSDSTGNFYAENSMCCVECSPCQTAMEGVRDNSVSLILTDPPHSDRIPYLELSELWNSILCTESSFDAEIVISNAKERGKTSTEYTQAMSLFFDKCDRVLRNDGFLVLLYNARQSEGWSFVDRLVQGPGHLRYLGQFPCNYSAGSVVQDNRKGGLKSDIALVFGKSRADSRRLQQLRSIPNWSEEAPTK